MSADPFENETGEIITPPTDLRKKVRVLSKREAAKFDPVAAAEQALKQLSHNFENWMGKEADQLLDAWQKAKDLETNKTNLVTLYQEFHNIKGQAATLGYPLVGRLAANFCFLFERLEDDASLPYPLVEQHVSAARAMIAEGAHDEKNALGVNLVSKLEEVTDDYLGQMQKPKA